MRWRKEKRDTSWRHMFHPHYPVDSALHHRSLLRIPFLSPRGIQSFGASPLPAQASNRSLPEVSSPADCPMSAPCSVSLHSHSIGLQSDGLWSIWPLSRFIAILGRIATAPRVRTLSSSSAQKHTIQSPRTRGLTYSPLASPSRKGGGHMEGGISRASL